MATKPTAPRAMSGTYGMFYWQGVPVYEVSSFEAKLKVNRETVTFAGETTEDSKLMGISGEWTVKLRKVYSRSAALAKKIKAGQDPRVTFVGKVSDPDAYGSERLVLYNCWFGDLTLMTYEAGKLIEEEFSGGFTNFSFPDTDTILSEIDADD